MFITHLPVGYIVSSLYLCKTNVTVNVDKLLAAGISGAIFPDIDLLYFYLIDQQQHHHHHYMTHFPILWIGLLLISISWKVISNSSFWAIVLFIFSLNGFIHLVLDTLVGDIWWFAPLIDQPFSLFTVPARYQPWWLNFILHWSFMVELSLVAAALLMFNKQKNRHRFKK